MEKEKKAPELSEAELATLKAVREELADKLPADLNTDFELLRWHRYHKGNVKNICRYLQELIVYRRVWKVDDVNFDQNMHQHPMIKQYLHFFSITDPGVFIYDQNKILFYEKGINNPKEVSNHS